jgi:hypothetical protein
MKKHTSAAKYNVILAGVQLILKETAEKLNGLRRQSKGRNFGPAEREIRMRLNLVKEAVKMAERHLDRHLEPLNAIKLPRLKQDNKPLFIPDISCFECQNPSCKGQCDRKDEEE